MICEKIFDSHHLVVLESIGKWLGLILGINLGSFLLVLINYVALLDNFVFGIYLLLLFKCSCNMIMMISFRFKIFILA